MSGPQRGTSPPQLDNFDFRSLLGSGGYADVYLYEQQRPRREVAVKVLLAEGLTEAGRRQFAAEADLMAALSAHPAIVTIYGADISADGRPYLVMEYYPGSNLRARSRTERIPVAEVLRIGVQVCSAVETAHRAGIIHRDIKPANILTSRYNKPGLTDFGISASTHDAVVDDLEGMSVPWAPPEAFGSQSALDARSDVYSLGATLYTLLAGRSPFERRGASNTQLDLMERIEREPVAPTGRTDVPVSLERLLAQCMAKVPALRPSSALDLAHSLQQVEVEMRLAPTPIDVMGDEPSTSRANASDDDDRTRVRGIVTIAPEPAWEPAPAPAQAAEADAVTRLRAQSVDPDSQAATPMVGGPADPTGRSGRRGLLVAVGAGVAVAVIAAIVLIVSGGNDSASVADSAAPAATGAAAPSTLMQDRPEAPTDVTVAREDPARVRIAWTAPDAQPGDVYAYWRTDGTSEEVLTTTETAVVVEGIAPDEAPCFVVVAVRSGLNSIEPDAPTCATPQ